MISVEQIRAARAMLGLGQKELAQRAGISIATFNNIERKAQRDPKISTIKAIQDALEAEGIEFLMESQGRQGILLTPKPDKSKPLPILIVDDSRHDRITYKRWLDDMPGHAFQIIEANDGKAGFNAFDEFRPACVILDFMMYGIDGFQLLATMRQGEERMPPIILVTGMHSEAIERKARTQGVFAYLDKNQLSKEKFYATVEHALQD